MRLMALSRVFHRFAAAVMVRATAWRRLDWMV
jgi:hypothetical protein